MNIKIRNACFMSVLALGLVGCGGSTSVDGGSDSERGTLVENFNSFFTAAIATVSSDFDASEIAIVDMEQSDLMVDEVVYESADSDITIAAHQDAFYRLGRNNIDAITKFTVGDSLSNEWEYSAVEGDESSSNVYDVVFVNEQKAYVLRYGSTIAWIVNPMAEKEQDFKIGELDLSAYDDGDGLPEVAGGTIVGNQLFVFMQRVDRDAGWAPVNTSYVAVFDTETDQEVETGQGEGGLKGIALKARNPLSMSYLEGVGLFVQSIGPFFGDDYTGGIEKINLADYSTTYLLDDGDSSSHPFGRINHFAVVNEFDAYFVAYFGWQKTSLYWIDPLTGDVSGDVVAGLDGVDIRHLARDPEGNLWVAIADSADPRVLVIDPETNTVIDEIKTELNPTKIVFTEEKVAVE